MDVGGWAGRGGLKKKKSEYIRWQIRERGPSIKMTSGRDVWKSKTYCADLVQGKEKEDLDS